MGGEFHVRNARLADAERIYALIREQAVERVPRSLGHVVENIDRFLVAEGPDGALAGCIAYQVWPEIGDPLKATVELQSVAVRETCRRKGIGSMLVNGALARVRVLKPADVTVLTLTPEFFATLGFREIPKTRIMHKLYTGCINCTKHTDPFTCPEKAMALEMREDMA